MSTAPATSCELGAVAAGCAVRHECSSASGVPVPDLLTEGATVTAASAGNRIAVAGGSRASVRASVSARAASVRDVEMSGLGRPPAKRQRSERQRPEAGCHNREHVEQ